MFSDSRPNGLPFYADMLVFLPIVAELSIASLPKVQFAIHLHDVNQCTIDKIFDNGLTCTEDFWNIHQSLPIPDTFELPYPRKVFEEVEWANNEMQKGLHWKPSIPF